MELPVFLSFRAEALVHPYLVIKQPTSSLRGSMNRGLAARWYNACVRLYIRAKVQYEMINMPITYV